MGLLDKILGRPLKSSEAEKEELTVPTGVPVLGLDALASTAYGPEAALTILVSLGVAGLHYIAPAYKIHAMDEQKPGYQTIFSQLVAAVAGRGGVLLHLDRQHLYYPDFLGADELCRFSAGLPSSC